MDKNIDKIIDISYEDIKSDKKYSIEEVSNKLGVSQTKVNHWIFKLNKAQDGNFFEDTSNITETDFEKIELAQGLLEDGYSYDDVVSYFKENSHALIDRDNNEITKDLSKMDSQVISKNITLEVKRQTDRIIDIMKDEIAITLVESFKEESSKIAKVSLEAMNHSKNEIINELKEQNTSYMKEIERLYSKQTEDLRRKLEEKDKELKEVKEEYNKKGFLSRLLGK